MNNFEPLNLQFRQLIHDLRAGQKQDNGQELKSELYTQALATSYK